MTKLDDQAAQPGRYVKVNDLHMYYEEYGSGEPLVLIHGAMGTTRSWDEFLPSLSRHFRVFTAESRGHGRTDNQIGKLNYRLMADDLLVFIKNLGMIKPLICGYSDGGQIALEIGIRYPNLAQALVLVAAGYKFTSEYYLNALKEWGFEGPGVVNIEQIKKAWADEVQTYRELHSPIYGLDHWRTLLQLYSVMWLTPLGYTEEDFHKIIAPTLILIGDRDTLFQTEEAVEMYRMIPNAELAVVPNSSHGFPWRKVELFTSIILEFLLHHSAQSKVD